MGAFLASLFLMISSQAAAAERYGAYGLYPQGPTRATAMGGAFMALSDDASGIVYNPAGLAFQKYWGDVGGNINTVYNRETDLNSDGVKDGLPYTYLYYATSFRMGNLGFGAGFSSPYNTNISFDADAGAFKEKRELQMTIASFDFPIAYRVSESFSVGMTFQLSNLDQRYKFTSTNPAATPISVNSSGGNVFTAFGMSYRPSEDMGFAVYHQPEKNFYVDPALNSQTGGVNWFRSTVVPAKTSVGSYFRTSPSLLFAFDVDHYAPLENTVYVGSELIPGTIKRAAILNQAQFVVHGGLEWRWIDTQWFDFYWRFGAYNEPARLAEATSRLHTTAGFEIRWWTLSLGLAFDSAPDFVNAAAGLGLSLKFYL